MTRKYDALPQLSDRLFITDGGLETTLIYREGLELPSFAAFVLLKDENGRQALRKYFAAYAELAQKYGTGLILESATWRANPDWAKKLGYSDAALDDANRLAVDLLHNIRSTYENDKTPIVISGCVGPRGDGYQPDKLMNAEEAETYHTTQIRTFERAGVDLITAITMNYVEEAVGVVWAARALKMPVAISFTVETNGRLPTGYTLEEAIEEVDDSTDKGAAYFMVNCAHPSHFADAIDPAAPWAQRIRGIRVNASKLSHAELDKAIALDDGNPAELGEQCSQLKGVWPRLNILGGCCGTDERHVEAMCQANLTQGAK